MSNQVIAHVAFIWALKALKAEEQLYWTETDSFDGSVASGAAAAQEALEALQAGRKIKQSRAVYDRFCIVMQDLRFQAWELAPFFFVA